MDESLVIVDIFPSEIVQMIWDFLPLRTRATSCKSLFETHYSDLIRYIPRFESYVIKVIRDTSSSYIFRLILEHRYDYWMQLGRWVTHGGKHAGVWTSYISYLMYRCRAAKNHKCLREIQQYCIQPITKSSIKYLNIPRPIPKRSSKNHKHKW